MKKPSKPVKRVKHFDYKYPLTILFVAFLVVFSSYKFLQIEEHKVSQTLTNRSVNESKIINSANNVTQVKKMAPEVKNDYVIPPISNGLAPLLTTIPTKQNVVFLGIDDGINKEAFELQMMKAHNIKASLYLANIYIKDNPKFFKDFVKAGSYIENHTVNHRQLSKLSYAEQKKEICEEADLQATQFGRRPVLFRPPYGDYNQNTLRAAADCGMKAVVTWIAKANGGSMQYQIGNSLRPGDIVLMHFRPEFKSDMQAFIDAEKAAGLHTALLEDWLQ